MRCRAGAERRGGRGRQATVTCRARQTSSGQARERETSGPRTCVCVCLSERMRLVSFRLVCRVSGLIEQRRAAARPRLRPARGAGEGEAGRRRFV